MRGASIYALVLLASCGDTTTTIADAGDAGAMDATQQQPDTGTDAGTDAPTDAADDMDVAVDSVIDVGVDAADAALDSPSDAGATGYVLWLDAAKGITKNGSLVTGWADQSPQKNDAVAVFASPSFVASGINGLPVVRFSASGKTRLGLNDAASLQWGTGDYLIAVVARFDNDPTWQSSAAGAFYLKLNGNGTAVSFFANTVDSQLKVSAGLELTEDTNNGASIKAAYNDGAARLYVARRSGATIELRVNGAQVAMSSQNGSVDVSNVGAQVGIGSYISNSGNNLDGDIAEMVAIKGFWSANDLATLETSLKSKYGL